MRRTEAPAVSLILLLALLPVGCSSTPSTPERFEAYCESWLTNPSTCTSACLDARQPCGALMGDAITSPDDLLQLAACNETCPTVHECIVDGFTFRVDDCGCRADCIGALSPEVQERLVAYLDCVEAEVPECR